MRHLEHGNRKVSIESIRIASHNSWMKSRTVFLTLSVAFLIAAPAVAVAQDTEAKLRELIQAEFDRHKPRKLKLKERPEKLFVKLRTITVLKNSDQRTPDAQKELIHEIRKRIIEGADFASEAKAHSQDSRREQGGEWGWIDQDTFSNPVSSVAFSLEEDTVSAVVEGKRAYHLLLVEERRKGGYVSRSDRNDEQRRRC